MDIRMPGKNGLEAIREARNAAPDTQWIILTGFSEFEYAKEAIGPQAFDYLLKPVDPSELEPPLRKLEAQLQERRFCRSRHFEMEAAALLQGSACQQELIRGCRYLAGALICFDGTLEEQEQSLTVRPLAEAVRAELMQVPSRDLLTGVALLPDKKLALVIGSRMDSPKRMEASGRLERLERMLQEHRKPNLAATLLQAEDASTPESLLERMEELRRLAPYRALLGLNGLLTCRELRACEASPGCRELMQAVHRLVQTFQEGVYVSYMAAVEDLDQPLKSREGGGDSFRTAAARYLQTAIGSLWDGTGSAEAGIKHLRGMGQLLLGDQASKRAKPDLVEQTLAFIDEHYMKEISIGEIAAKLGVTPNYLSDLFHQKTGTTFMKYVTRNRMLKAKELLADPSIQVQQAAEMVGYFSTRHFTKLFTAFEGRYPSEYKKKLNSSG
ncbi:helix-turn-helix domain-containing protein [Paenibacillus sp. P26]|nr:helix-turn-helix domain-containing protein [Paenibacillus sp. P26]